MTLYFADQKKYFLNTKEIIQKCISDKVAGQLIRVRGSVFGITVMPGKKWTYFCEQQYREFQANHVWLEDISFAPGGTLDFINDLPNCKRLTIENGKGVNLAPLAGNSQLIDLQIYPKTKVVKFDLTSLPELRRCMVPVCPQLMSFSECRKLVCLFLCGGRYEGALNLEFMRSLEELFIESVSGLKAVVLNSDVRLRSLQLRCLKAFQTVEPPDAVLDELMVVDLRQVPNMDIQWLAQAQKLECISLWLGEIPSIRFLSGLKKLQVLSLFGSKVKDKDLSFRDTLKGELDSRFWGKKKAE